MDYKTLSKLIEKRCHDEHVPFNTNTTKYIGILRRIARLHDDVTKLLDSIASNDNLTNINRAHLVAVLIKEKLQRYQQNTNLYFVKLYNVNLKLACKRDYLYTHLTTQSEINPFADIPNQLRLYDIIRNDIYIATRATKNGKAKRKTLRNFYHHIYSLLCTWLLVVNYTIATDNK